MICLVGGFLHISAEGLKYFSEGFHFWSIRETQSAARQDQTAKSMLYCDFLESYINGRGGWQLAIYEASTKI